jgi:hypothetical protein
VSLVKRLWSGVRVGWASPYVKLGLVKARLYWGKHGPSLNIRPDKGDR